MLLFFVAFVLVISCILGMDFERVKGNCKVSPHMRVNGQLEIVDSDYCAL